MTSENHYIAIMVWLFEGTVCIYFFLLEKKKKLSILMNRSPSPGPFSSSFPCHFFQGPKKILAVPLKWQLPWDPGHRQKTWQSNTEFKGWATAHSLSGMLWRWARPSLFTHMLLGQCSRQALWLHLVTVCLCFPSILYHSHFNSLFCHVNALPAFPYRLARGAGP